MTEKHWLQSKTVWFNIASAILIVANETAPLLDVLDGEAAEKLRVYIGLLQVVGNIILRFVTKTGVRV